jgi:hypothetical protein
VLGTVRCWTGQTAVVFNVQTAAIHSIGGRDWIVLSSSAINLCQPWLIAVNFSPSSPPCRKDCQFWSSLRTGPQDVTVVCPVLVLFLFSL